MTAAGARRGARKGRVIPARKIDLERGAFDAGLGCPERFFERALCLVCPPAELGAFGCGDLRKAGHDARKGAPLAAEDFGAECFEIGRGDDGGRSLANRLY